MRCPRLSELPSPPPVKTGWPWPEESAESPDGRPWARVSIVTPSYNQGASLEATIRSVLLRGYPNAECVVIDGGSSYRGKGFTRDLVSQQEMVWLLDAGTFDETLSEDEIELAERFAYLWFFRYIVRLPFVCPPGRSFSLKTFRDLAPGGHPVIDALCEAPVTGRLFIDLNFAPVPRYVDA